MTGLAGQKATLWRLYNGMPTNKKQIITRVMGRSAFALQERGSALVAVFWLIGILGLAVFAVMRVVSFDSDVVAHRVHGWEARQFAERGIAVASNAVVKRGDQILNRDFSEEGASYEVKMRTEGERFNINFILLSGDRDLFLEIVSRMGLELDAAEELYDALVDWIDENDSVRLNGAESRYYEELGLIGMPYNRPFYDLEEMRLVRGFVRLDSIYSDWRNWFTVWSSGPLDMNRASAELIAAGVGGNIENTRELVERRMGPDLIEDTEDDAPFQDLNLAFDLLGVSRAEREIMNSRFTLQDNTDRIESIGHAGQARYRITMILRNRSGRPTILQRKEEILP